MKYKNNHQDKIPDSFQEALKLKLEKEINNKDLERFRTVVLATCESLDIDMVDCAAALASLYQPGISQHRQHFQTPSSISQHPSKLDPATNRDIKMVRYRLEIGRRHKITIEELKNLLVDETGVDRQHIGFIDMHHHYTLLKLPEGMPPDIYNHLKSFKVNQHVLKIKRLGNYNKQHQRQANGGKQTVHRKSRKIQGKVKSTVTQKPQLDSNG